MAYVLHQLLSEAAASEPQREAIRLGSRGLTYSQLNAAANRIATTLVEAGVRPGDRVAIDLPKGIEAVACIYGAMRAGAAYVPLDSQAPAVRAAAVADSCEITALVATPELVSSVLPLTRFRPGLAISVGERLPEVSPGCPVLRYGDVVEGQDPGDPLVPVIDQDLAVVLFTSGSTGAPKGVMVSHRSIMVAAEGVADASCLSAEDRVSAYTPIHFSMSVVDMFPSALRRATLVVVRDEDVLLGHLEQVISDQRITVWASVPSTLKLLLRSLSGPGALPDLRHVWFGGEVFPTKDLREFQRMLPRAEMWQIYGGTETMVRTVHHVAELPDDHERVPLGLPLPNVSALVLGDEDRPVVSGEVGELYVRGAQLMRGYWRDPEKTAEALVPNPLDPAGGERVFRTGDLVRLLPGGNLQFVGRRDDQIKSRGVRIELGEVDAALGAHPKVKEATAVAVPHEQWGTAIVACVVAEDGADLDEKAIKTFVGERLPMHMVPARVEFREALPRTSTGKTDRRALADSFDGAVDEES